MQNSELYRRGFVVPLNKEAEHALVNEDVDNNTAVKFYELPDLEVFEGLWEKGLFETINAQLGTMIDDYEEERIESTKVRSLKKIVKEFKKLKNLSVAEKAAVLALEELCDTALEKNSSLFFIL